MQSADIGFLDSIGQIAPKFFRLQREKSMSWAPKCAIPDGSGRTQTHIGCIMAKDECKKAKQGV